MTNSRDVFGIDLGTTNSCIARYGTNGPEIIAIDAQGTVPSVVAHDGEGWLIGRRARNYAMLHPLRAVSSIKRRMGDLNYRCEIGGTQHSPTDISSKILQYLKEEAERNLRNGEESVQVEEVVITVPAWFGDGERHATLAAGRQAGFNVLRIVNEPTAAALVYSIPQKLSGRAQKWVVYDLGGGTFDVSVLSVSEAMKEILSSSGNCFLGGDDFDYELVKHFSAWLKERYNKNPENDPLLRAKLKQIAEETKIALSVEAVVRVQEVIVSGEDRFELDLEVTRDCFEGLITPFIDSTLRKVQQALEEAHCTKNEIDRLLLVGGSTRIPLVSQQLQEFFDLTPDGYVDPDLSVALGAALQAGLTSGLEYRQVVIDVAAHTLGVGVFGKEDEKFMLSALLGLGEKRKQRALTFAPLIRKNTRLPAVFHREFFKMDSEQEVVRIEVYQGESSLTGENRFIGSFETPLQESSDMGIYIGFEYDLNGVINVSVKEAGADAPPKRYSMDLSKSAEANSEGRRFVELDEPGDSSESKTISNYLIQSVEAEMTKRGEPPDSFIFALLERYRGLLDQGSDDDIEQVEDELHEWLEREIMVVNG